MQEIKRISGGKWVLIAISLFLQFGFRLLPPIWGLNEIGMGCLCIFVGTMILLLFVDLAWPLFICLIAFSVSGIYTLGETLAGSLGSVSFWYFVFAAMVVSVLNESDIIKRLAYKFVSLPFARRSPWLFLFVLLAGTMLIGSITDPVAMIIVMTAFTEKILYALSVQKGDRFGETAQIGILVAVGLSYGITPFAHAVPVVVINYFNESLAHVNFFDYALTGYAMGLAAIVLFLVFARFLFRVDVSCLREFDVSTVDFEMKPFGTRGKASCAIYLLTIFLWLLPGMIEHVLSDAYIILNSYLGTAGPLAIACALMCTVPVEGRPLMDVTHKLREVPWQASFIAATAPLLGSVLTDDRGNVMDAVAAAIGPAMGALPPLVFVALICLFATVLTDFCSDMTTAVLASVVAISLISTGVVQGVNPGALAIGIGIGQGCAFATPAGSAYTAYASSTGWISRKNQLLQAGLMDVAIGVLAGTLGYALACALMG